jgi:hypothetical protein
MDQTPLNVVSAHLLKPQLYVMPRIITSYFTRNQIKSYKGRYVFTREPLKD